MAMPIHHLSIKFGILITLMMILVYSIDLHKKQHNNFAILKYLRYDDGHYVEKKPYSPDIRGFFHNHVTSMHSFAGDYQC